MVLAIVDSVASGDATADPVIIGEKIRLENSSSGAEDSFVSSLSL